MEYGLSLGSNMGDRFSNLMTAADKISQLENVTVLDQSPIYETQPVEVLPMFKSENFLNCVMIITTEQNPHQLHKQLQKMEVVMGRPKEHGKNTPRIIDIDIIYAGDQVINSPDLTIPHHSWKNRRFVVEPLSILRPELVLPETKNSVKDILNSMPENPKVIPYKR